MKRRGIKTRAGNLPVAPGDHAYVVIGYDDMGTTTDTGHEDDDVIMLYNPHGFEGDETEDQMAKIFPKITIGQLKAYVENIRVPEQP